MKACYFVANAITDCPQNEMGSGRVRQTIKEKLAIIILAQSQNFTFKLPKQNINFNAINGQ